MQAVLSLPNGATVTSGSNPSMIGTMTAGTSATVSWIILCQDEGVCDLQVDVSGLDSNGYPCSAYDSITVAVSGEKYSPPSSELPYLLAIIVSLVAATLLITLSVILKRRRILAREGAAYPVVNRTVIMVVGTLVLFNSCVNL